MLYIRRALKEKLEKNEDLYSFHCLGEARIGVEAFEIVLNHSLVMYGDNDYVELYCLATVDGITIETCDLISHPSKLPFDFELKWETDLETLNETIKKVAKDLKIFLKLIN